MIETKQRVSSLNGVDLIELTGPKHWSYEGVTPHYYVVHYEGIYYAYLEDKDHYDMVEHLMHIGSGTKEYPYGARHEAPTMEKLIELITENNYEDQISEE